MTAKALMALAQAHRSEPSQANYKALADAVRAMDGEVSRLTAEVERLTPLQFRQAPCYKFCEANAFQIEMRRLTAERDAYQRAADKQAAQHKVERDGLAKDAEKSERLRVVMAALLANPTSELMKNIARAALKETK
jgi:hypothetical protein